MKATHEQTSAYYEIIVEIVKGCAFKSFLEAGIGAGLLAGKLKNRCTLLTQISGVEIRPGATGVLRRAGSGLLTCRRQAA